MKKLVMSILTILTCGAAYALPVGNPSEASLFLNGLWCESSGCCDFCDPCFSWCDAWSFRVGYYGDFVFDRHLEVGDDNDNDDVEGGDLQHAEIFTNAGYLAVNFCNRVDVFATLGQSDFNTRQNTSVFIGGLAGFSGFESELWFSPAFSWSIGARATLWQCDCFALGIEGQYFSAKPHLDYLVLWGPAQGAKIHDHIDTHYKEWQVGLGVSYRIATSCPTLAFVPYAAVKYARAHWDIEDTVLFPLTTTALSTSEYPDFRAKKHWGWALGLSFTMCDLAGVTVEGRWGDEKALYVNGQVRF